MRQSQLTNSVSIDEIWILYNRARGHYVYDEDDESRNLEAFLMLAVLFEGVITLFGLVCLEKEEDLTALYQSRKRDRNRNYSTDKAVTDLYLLRKISTEEFRNLMKFKQDRNNCFHNQILNQKNKEVEKNTRSYFEEHEEVFKLIVKKFQKELEK